MGKNYNCECGGGCQSAAECLDPIQFLDWVENRILSYGNNFKALQEFLSSCNLLSCISDLLESEDCSDQLDRIRNIILNNKDVFTILTELCEDSENKAEVDAFRECLVGKCGELGKFLNFEVTDLTPTNGVLTNASFETTTLNGKEVKVLRESEIETFEKTTIEMCSSDEICYFTDGNSIPSASQSITQAIANTSLSITLDYDACVTVTHKWSTAARNLNTNQFPHHVHFFLRISPPGPDGEFLALFNCGDSQLNTTTTGDTGVVNVCLPAGTYEITPFLGLASTPIDPDLRVDGGQITVNWTRKNLELIDC